MNKNNLVNIDSITAKQIAQVCDHTFIKCLEEYIYIVKYEFNGVGDPVALRESQFNNFLEGLTNPIKPYAVCVRHDDVNNTVRYLEKNNLDIIVASVVGFPNGSVSTKVKIADTAIAIEYGAREVDMVLNYSELKRGNYKEVYNDISKVTERAHRKNLLVKLILETSELTPYQISEVCALAKTAECDFVKTSSGYSKSNANASNLKIMRECFDKGVKMSGKVKPENVKELLYAVSGRDDGYIELNPLKVRVGESSLLDNM